MIHIFNQRISKFELPDKFTYPFSYTPHPLCVAAAEKVKNFLATQRQWKKELATGKMFGVLLIRTDQRRIGYLAAFSGNLNGQNNHPYFVPPIYDLLQPQGFFKPEEELISSLNRQIGELESAENFLVAKQTLQDIDRQASKAIAELQTACLVGKKARAAKRQDPLLSAEALEKMRGESQFQKAELKRMKQKWGEERKKALLEVEHFEAEIERLKKERRSRSSALQELIFDQYRLLNAYGEEKSIARIFYEELRKAPPAGTGECALPKLLQYAYLHELKPLAMAEFWWGGTPKEELRIHNHYYPACRGKCKPILTHMLKGLEVESSADALKGRKPCGKIEIVSEDEHLLVIDKPSGMLSVPGTDGAGYSVYDWARDRYPQATGPLIVHRLDMATSGLMVLAKTKAAHKNLQEQFATGKVSKYYLAVLDGDLSLSDEERSIRLPICPDPFDRPRQMVSCLHGKRTVTEYVVLNNIARRSLVRFHPLTGRTHQLRVHAAHPQGLNAPIVGDELYGKKSDRLYLHSQELRFKHPVNPHELVYCKHADWEERWASV